MNKIIPVTLLALFLLGACTETIELDRYIFDTIYVDKPRTVAPTLVTIRDTVTQTITDTVTVEVLIRDTVINNITTVDTVIHVVTKDSIIYKEVEKLVYVYDTIIQTINKLDTVFVYVTDTVEIQTIVYDRTITYLDTAVVVSYMRPTYYVPDAIQPFVEEFYGLCHQYGVQTQGSGMIIVTFVEEATLFGEGWVSSSFEVSDNSQQVIYLDQRLPPELHRASMLRELSRLQLKKKYSNDPNKIMNPLWGYDREIKQIDLDNLFK